MITPQRAHASHAPENCLNSVPLLVAGAASLQHCAASTRAKLGEKRCDRSACVAARRDGRMSRGEAHVASPHVASLHAASRRAAEPFGPTRRAWSRCYCYRSCPWDCPL